MDPVFSSLFQTLAGLGTGGILAAVFAYLWRDERTERRDVQKDNVQLLRDKIISDNALASALDKIADRVKAV